MRYFRIDYPILLNEIRLPKVNASDTIKANKIALVTGSLRCPPHSLIWRLNIVARLMEIGTIDHCILTSWASDESLYRDIISRTRLCEELTTFISIADKQIPEWYSSLHFQQSHIVACLAFVPPTCRVLRLRTDKFDFTFSMLEAGIQQFDEWTSHGRVLLGWKHPAKLSWIPFFQPDGIIYASRSYFAGLLELIPSSYSRSANPGLNRFVSGTPELGLLGANFIYDDIFLKGFDSLWPYWSFFTADPTRWMNYWSPHKTSANKYSEVFSHIVDNNDFEAVANMLAASWYIDNTFFASMTDESSVSLNSRSSYSHYAQDFQLSPLGSYISRHIDCKSIFRRVDLLANRSEESSC